MPLHSHTCPNVPGNIYAACHYIKNTFALSEHITIKSYFILIFLAVPKTFVTLQRITKTLKTKSYENWNS